MLASAASSSSIKKRKVAERPATRRSVSEHDERQKRIKIASPSPPTPTKEQFVNIRRAMRNGNPTCLHFGIDKESRDLLYPEHYFCDRCDDYVNSMILSGRKGAIKRDSRNFMCDAGHTSFIFPTAMKKNKVHHLLRELTVSSSEDCDEEENSASSPMANTAVTRTPATLVSTTTVLSVASSITTHQSIESPAVPPIANDQVALRNLDNEYEELARNEVRLLREKNKQLESDLVVANNKVLSLQTNHDDMQIRLQHYLLQSHTPKNLATRAINLPFDDSTSFDGTGIVDDSEKRRKVKVEKFVAMLMQSDFNNGLVRLEIIRQVKKYYRDEIYCPWKILRVMDKKGGKISLESLDLLRTLETFEKKYVWDTILCSSASVQRVARIVEDFGKTFIPFEVGNVPERFGSGEIIRFNIKHVIKLLLSATGTARAARTRQITMPSSCDTTRISKGFGFVIMGLKFTDRGGRCPLTHRPLILQAEEGRKGQSFVQSYENCIPLSMVVGKETNDLVRWAFKENFKVLELEDKLTEDDTSSILGEGFKPLRCPCDADKKMHWAGTGAGGAAKVVKKPCMCCAIGGKEMAKANSELCETWCQNWKAQGKLEEFPNWQCWHKPFITPERIAKIREDADSIRQELGNLSECLTELIDESLLNHKEDPRGTPQANALRDPASIHFKFSEASSSEKNEYMMKVASDLLLRHLPSTGSLGDMQERLKTAVTMEYTLRHIEDELAHGRVSMATAMYLVINALPCILHLENRVGLKIMTRLLRIGMSNAKEGLLEGLGSCDTDRIANYLAKVESICCNEIWGSELTPVSWKCPYDAKEKTVGTLCLDNGRTREVVQAIEVLVEFCIPAAERDNWTTTVQYYEDAMAILLKHEDLTNEEIESFQWNIDRFAQEWMTINMGDEGVTNYIHDLQGGHISDYLKYWRNLYVHSQQGWEAMNFVVKKYWFRATNRGGGRGSRNRLLPVARWLQRRMVWMTGTSFQEMKERLKTGDVIDLDALIRE
jgi:hypothetical protein